MAEETTEDKPIKCFKCGQPAPFFVMQLVGDEKPNQCEHCFQEIK